MKNRLPKYSRFFTLLLALVFLLHLGSCRTGEQNAAPEWVPHDDTGTQHFKILGEYCIAAVLKSPLTRIQPIANFENQNKAGSDSTTIVLLRMGMRDHSSIMRHGVSDRTGYADRVNYLSFELEKRIFIRCGDKPVFPYGGNFENPYDLSPYFNFLLAFPPLNSCPDPVLIIDDSHFGFGPIKIPL